ncbi:uncharacterized protein LOC134207770 [Armigeres subalbatus]|uniref:uncharacterized protein LOC134207770 n=1 Tax=Armigeres subalbatus TaxID=124917 RepID=UPI002ED4481E
MNRKRDGLSAFEVATEQLDAIIDFASSKHNISKDLKRSLQKLRKSMLDAKLERAVGTAKCKPVKSVESRSTQTEAQGFADSGKVESTEGVPAKTVVPKSTQTEAQVFAGTSGVTTPTEQTQKRGRQSPGDELPGGRSKTRRVTTPNKGSGAGKLNPGQVPPKPGEEGPGKVRPLRQDGDKGLRQAESSQPHQTREIEGNDASWTLVKNKRKPKTSRAEKKAQANEGSKKSRVGANRSRGDALVITADEAKYSDVLKAMRSDVKLGELGADVRRIRRTRMGEMILELKRGVSQKGAACKKLAEEVLGETAKVRALTTEVNLRVKDLDEITEVEELVTALRRQCEVETPTAAVRLRKGPAGTQVALVRLSAADASKVVKLGSVKMGWSVCPVRIYEQPEVCFKCLEPGHKQWDCKGPDRSNLCRRCGLEGHKAQCCTNPPNCLICSSKAVNSKHPMGGSMCPAFKRAAKSKCR